VIAGMPVGKKNAAHADAWRARIEKKRQLT
jgi:hypothetical protein